MPFLRPLFRRHRRNSHCCFFNDPRNMVRRGSERSNPRSKAHFAGFMFHGWCFSLLLSAGTAIFTSFRTSPHLQVLQISHGYQISVGLLISSRISLRALKYPPPKKLPITASTKAKTNHIYVKVVKRRSKNSFSWSLLTGAHCRNKAVPAF